MTQSGVRKLGTAEERRVGGGFDTETAGFGVYVHFPFCQRKCPYCDFNSHVRIKGWDEEAISNAYVRELDYISELTGPRVVNSIFFGGGTPSLMQPKTVGYVIDAVAKRWTLEEDAEITLEANPGSAEATRFRGYKQAGVNRISVGVQAFRDHDLQVLGRIHSVDEAKAALALASDVFGRFSFDLIYARPQQRVDDWRRELAEALTFAGGRHLSLYQLTIEPETPFAKLHAAGKLKVPDPDLALAFYEVTQKIMEAAGLPAYEISNHAAPGEESQHNLVYWRYGEYAGIGPGAHGRILSGGTRVAMSALKAPEAWLSRVAKKGNGFVDISVLNQDQMADEMLLMGLRLMEGVDLDRLEEVGGVRPARDVLDDLSSRGLIQFDEGSQRLKVNRKGRFILNEIVFRLSDSFERPGVTLHHGVASECS